MTPKYWFKIILGMLGIFVVGMGITTAIRAGKNKVTQFVESASPITVPLLSMPFRTTGRGELGVLRSLRIERDAPREVSGFHLTARLNDGVDVDQFDLCEITVENPEPLDEHTAFMCLTEADSAFSDLVQFGTITFEPSGETHRLMVPSAIRDEIRTAFAAKHDETGDSVSVDSASGGQVTIEIGGQPIVQIRADSTGGRVVVNDPKSGQKIVDIRGTPQ